MMKVAGMVLIAVLAVIVLLLAVALVKTLLTKPNTAANAHVLPDNSDRAVEYGKRLARMIQCETISSRFEENREKFYKFHGILEEMFPNVHKVCEKQVFDGSLLFKWKGSGKHAPILFMSHQDVVAPGTDWEHEPFSGDIDEEGKVWGRGTVDTKGSLFCIFTALEELIEAGFKPECDVYIASSCTEEWNGEGAPRTAKYLKEHGVKLALLIDEGGMILERPMAGVNGTYAMVGVVEKGYGDVKFTAKGHGGHASVPKKNSPLVRLGKFMSYVDKKSLFKNQFSPTLEEMFRRLAPNMDFGMKFIFTNMWLFKPLLKNVIPMINSAAGAMMHTTLAFTTAKGAEGLNVLPQEAYVTGNMRYIHHQPDEESVQLISRVAAKFDIETEVIYKDSPCPIVDYKGDAFRLVENVISDVYPGIGVSPYIMTGSTDAKYYREVSDNCIRFAPLYINNQQYASIHSNNENIYQGALPMGVDFYKEVVKRS